MNIGQNIELKQRDTIFGIGPTDSYRDQHERRESGPIFVVCLVYVHSLSAYAYHEGISFVLAGIGVVAGLFVILLIRK